MEHTRRNVLETVLGLGLVAVLVVSVLVIYKSFRGDFGEADLAEAIEQFSARERRFGGR